jgi:sensor histidine kinase YesM
MLRTSYLRIFWMFFKLSSFLFPFHFQGTPSGARHISFPVLFAPLFLLQGAGVLFAAYRLVEKIVLLAQNEVGSGTYSALSSKAREFFGFLHHGSK